MNEQDIQKFDKLHVEAENLDHDIKYLSEKKDEIEKILSSAIADGYQTPAQRKAEESKPDPELVRKKEERKAAEKKTKKEKAE